MDLYEIIITPDAEADLYEISDYISFTLLAPETAMKYIRSIRDSISKLSYMGASIAPVELEPWHSRGIRKITARKFLVYYRLDEATKCVYVLNVIYARRDQVKALNDMKSND